MPDVHVLSLRQSHGRLHPRPFCGERVSQNTSGLGPSAHHASSPDPKVIVEVLSSPSQGPRGDVQAGHMASDLSPSGPRAPGPFPSWQRSGPPRPSACGAAGIRSAQQVLGREPSYIGGRLSASDERHLEATAGQRRGKFRDQKTRKPSLRCPFLALTGPLHISSISMPSIEQQALLCWPQIERISSGGSLQRYCSFMHALVDTGN